METKGSSHTHKKKKGPTFGHEEFDSEIRQSLYLSGALSSTLKRSEWLSLPTHKRNQNMSLAGHVLNGNDSKRPSANPEPGSPLDFINKNNPLSLNPFT
jgi:hypothetical protein